MRKNKGFTLIEVLVVLALLSLVLTSVAAVLVTGSKSFAKGNEDAQVQKEAQFAVNQIEDMIIDTNGGLRYNEEDAYKELELYNAVSEGGTTVYYKESIKWTVADGKITYSKWHVNYDPSTKEYVVVGPAIYEGQLLAENVTDFQVDLSDIELVYGKKNEQLRIVKSVTVKAAYEGASGIVSYATTPLVTLRNRMIYGGSLEDIFDNTPVQEDSLCIYISNGGDAVRVLIQDRVTTVMRGEGYRLYAMINTENDVNDLVNWEIEETNSTSKISPDGYLSVGEGEPNDYLTIITYYRNNPERNAKAVVAVTGGSLKSLDSVRIVPREGTEFAPNYVSFVTATGFTEEEKAADFVYKWEVKDAAWVNNFADDDPTLSLNVKQVEYTFGKVLDIKLTVTSKSLGTSVSDTIQYNIPRKGDKGDSNLEREKSNQQWFAYASDKAGGADDNYQLDKARGMEYYFCDAAGTRIDALNEYLQYIKINSQLGSFELTLGSGLPANESYYLKVVIPLKNYDNPARYYVYERIIYISSASLLGKNKTAEWKNANSTYVLEYELGGYYPQAWKSNLYKVELVDIQYTAPTGVSVGLGTYQGYTVGAAYGMAAEVTFRASNGTQDFTVQSATFKVTMVDYPEIYCYSTITFN